MNFLGLILSLFLVGNCSAFSISNPFKSKNNAPKKPSASKSKPSATKSNSKEHWWDRLSKPKAAKPSSPVVDKPVSAPVLTSSSSPQPAVRAAAVRPSSPRGRAAVGTRRTRQ